MGSHRSNASAKERLKWTKELHDLFEKAVNQIGGPDSKCPSLFTTLLEKHTYIIVLTFKSMYICLLISWFGLVLIGATPKGILKAMAIPGLTIFHVKSHLQVSFSFSLLLMLFLDLFRLSFLNIVAFAEVQDVGVYSRRRPHK